MVDEDVGCDEVPALGLNEKLQLTSTDVAAFNRWWRDSHGSFD
jgi:hypothetical protein